jgi:acyl dehydratase
MRTLYFEDIVEGTVEWRGAAHVDKEEMLAYARTNDPWPAHVDEEAAKRTPFARLTASGGYMITLWYRLSHPILNNCPERMAFIAGVDWHLKFRRPVHSGDHLRFRTTVLSKRPSSKPGRGVVTSLGELINQDEETVLAIEAIYLVATCPQ